MTFPSEEYIKFVLEHPELQEGWEPSLGDYVIVHPISNEQQHELGLITGRHLGGKHYEITFPSGIRRRDIHRDWLSVVFRLDQLLRMLQAELASEFLAMGAYYNQEKRPEYRCWYDSVKDWSEDEHGGQDWEIAVAKELVLVRQGKG